MIAPLRFVRPFILLLSNTLGGVVFDRYWMLTQMWYFNANVIFTYTLMRKAAVVFTFKSLDNLAWCISSVPFAGSNGLCSVVAWACSLVLVLTVLHSPLQIKEKLLQLTEKRKEMIDKWEDRWEWLRLSKDVLGFLLGRAIANTLFTVSVWVWQNLQLLTFFLLKVCLYCNNWKIHACWL